MHNYEINIIQKWKKIIDKNFLKDLKEIYTFIFEQKKAILYICIYKPMHVHTHHIQVNNSNLVKYKKCEKF